MLKTKLILAVAGVFLALAAGGVRAQAAGGTITDNAAAAGIAQTRQSFDTLVFDYNGDGRQDFLYSPQNSSLGRQLWQNNGDGTFTLVTYLKGATTYDQHGCTTADYDGNGLADVYCALGAIHGTRAKANDLFLQTSPGVWADDATSGAQDTYGRGYSATTLDANGDGLPDLFVENNHPRPDGTPTPDRLFLNLGIDPVTGAWLGFADDPTSGVEVEEGDRGCNLTTDFNNDGLPDIAFCGSSRVHFYRNNGDGTFTDVSAALNVGSFFASDMKLVDLNHDGIRDMVYARKGQWGIRLGRATGGFAGGTQVHAMQAARAVEVTDVNGDGILDIYVLQGNGAPGCTMTNCPTNYPDRLYLGAVGAPFTELPGVPGATGSGDTVDAITTIPGGPSDLIVGNGANLTTGPLQLIHVSP